MFAKKLFFLVAVAALVGFVWQFSELFLTAAPILAQTANKSPEVPKGEEKKSDVAPEVRAKAVKLLVQTAGEAQNFAAPENRVKGLLLAANLLWNEDQETARKLFQNAQNDLQAMIANFNNSEDENDNAYAERYSLDQLRQKLLTTLGERDPKAALAALQSLKESGSLKGGEETDGMNELELKLASAIAKADPQQGYAVAVKSLSTEFNQNTLTTLEDLYRNNSEYGAKYARDILTKFKSTKIRLNNANTVTTNSNAAVANINIRTGAGEVKVELYQLMNFFRLADKLNKMPLRGKDKTENEKKMPALTDGEMRELADYIAQNFARHEQAEPWTIGSSMSLMTKYSPGAAQIVRRRLNAEQAKMLDSFGDGGYEESGDKTYEELATEAESLTDPIYRDSRYSQAISKALEKNELEKAEEIAKKISNKESYSYIFDEIKTQTPLIKARRGDTVEVRQMLFSLKTNAEKVSALTELVAAVAAGGNKEAAVKIAEEANQYLPGQVRKQPNLEITVKIANAFAVVQPERAFSLLDASIAQMNELIAAGVMIDDFYEYRTVQNDEVLFDTMEQQGLTHTPNATALIKNLAAADFERTVALTERFSRLEIRVFARLKLAEALLDPNAAENEKQLRLQYQNEHEH